MPLERPVGAPRPEINFEKSSIFAKLFCTPDYEYLSEKRAMGMSIGARLGFLGGLGKIVMSPEMTFYEMMMSHKGWSTLQAAKGTFIGGLAGLTYIGTTQVVSKARNKDDLWNHFLAGYAGFAVPSVILNKGIRYFMMGGTITALFCFIIKFAGTSEIVLPALEYRRDIIPETKYPEIYMHYETIKDMKRMRKEGLTKYLD